MIWQWLSNRRRCCAGAVVAPSATAALPDRKLRRVRRIGSILVLLERLPEWMRRIHAENPQLFGEKRKLLQRKHQPAVVRVALDVGIKLRGEEIALDHVAFELGHIDAVGGEAA